ncbi:MAG: VWA domain-containing protein [Fimbriimonadaceae bacterium]
MIRFQEPWFALLFLPIAVGLWYTWRSFAGMARARKRAAFIVRALLTSLVTLCLMGPEARQENRGLATIFVVDRSDSVTEADSKNAKKFVDEAMRSLGPDDVAGVVSFGRYAQVESVPGGRRSLTAFETEVDGSSSDLAGAIRLASASLPEGKGRRIVVLSDGHETRGDALAAVEAAALEGIQVDVRPLGSDTRRKEVTVVELQTPNERRAEEPFDARIVVDSSDAQESVLVLERDGDVIARQAVRLEKGKSTIVVPQKLTKPGFYRYRATIEPTLDTDNRNNIGASFTSVRGKPQVLVLQGSTSHTELASALQAQGISVTLRGPSGVPLRADELQGYDAVFFNDIPATAMEPSQMAMFRAAVRDSAIGFAMIGGEGSFLPGGWFGTPVAEILPVDLNVRQRKSFPSTTVLIVVDASGSMGAMEGGVQKIQLAATAATETVNLLSELDQVGVAGSTDGIEFVAKIQPLKNKDKVKSEIRKLRPGMGGIYAEPSVKFARDELTKQDTKVRHFVLLADGSDVDSYGQSLSVIAEMKAKKITTSVVAIGDGKDVPFLRAVAAAGGGRFYLAKSASKLPAIFTQDVALMSRSAIEELTFVPQIRTFDDALRGLEGGVPALFAYCLTSPRPLARTSMVSPKSDPILATWQFGLGKSLAFTSDAQARWAGRWVGWEGFGQFWAQAARSLSRSITQNEYGFTVRHEGGKGVLELTAKDRLGNPIPVDGLKVRVSDPRGEAQDVLLTQEAPGLFSGKFDASDLGSYIVTASEPGPAGETRVSANGFSVPYPPEYRSFATNTPMLSAIAENSSGRFLTEPKEALRPLQRPGDSVSELWPLLALIAAVLVPVDVAVRRLAVPWAAVWAWIRRRAHDTYEEPEARLSTAALHPDAEAEAPSPERRPDGQQQPRPQARPKTPQAKPGSAGTQLLERRKAKQRRP